MFGIYISLMVVVVAAVEKVHIGLFPNGSEFVNFMKVGIAKKEHRVVIFTRTSDFWVPHKI